MRVLSLREGEVLLLGLWLLCRLAVWVRQRRIDWRREALLLLMLINLAVIVRFVFFPMKRVEGQVQPLVINLHKLRPFRLNLVPLVQTARYKYKRDALINVIGNVTMFMPSGVILPLLYRRLNSFWKVVLAGAGLSLTIELLQLLTPRCTDLDDLIFNTLGTAIGCGLYYLLSPKKTNHSE